MKNVESGRPEPRLLVWRLLGGVVTLSVVISLFVAALHSDLDLTEGELILTEEGCRLLRHHGVALGELTGGGLCLLRARYRFTDDPDRFGRIKVAAGSGALEVRLPGRHVLSRARR